MTTEISIERLRSAIPALADGDRDFATSLVAQSATRGLSDKQIYWVRKLIERAEKPAKPVVTLGDIGGIYDLFTTARQHLQWPKIILCYRGDNGALPEIKLSVAGDRAKFPGTINVVDNDNRDRWYGRITTDGKWCPSRKETLPEAALDLLRRFSEDPAGVGAEQGHLTGNCCFCRRSLTDDRSTNVGYGPVCADRFGLPWGG